MEAEELNSDITEWTRRSVKAGKDAIGSQGIKHYPYSPNPVPLARALKSSVKKNLGLINRISYKFPRSGAFVHKGVSRGHPITNQRKVKPWFSAIDNTVEELGDIVANGNADLIVNNLSIK